LFLCRNYVHTYLASAIKNTLLELNLRRYDKKLARLVTRPSASGREEAPPRH
jgi:hypothetical protein